MTALAMEKCEPCTGETPRVEGAELHALMEELDDRWEVKDEQRLEATLKFKDFKSAMAFTNDVGELAEAAGHHPEICVTWGKATVSIWTHAIDGLSRNDFILAARIDELAQ